MNFRIKTPLVIILVMLLLGTALAGETEKIIQAAPDGAQFKDANVIILFSEKTYELEAAGRALEDTRYLVKVLNNKGREDYGDQKASFNSEKDTIEMVKAGTYQEDQTFVAVEEKAINDVTPVELAGAEIYANYLHRVFSFPVVDPGVSLLMHYKKTRDLEDDHNISDRVFFQFSEPLVRKELKIILPPGKNLIYRSLGFNGTLRLERDKEKSVYSLEVKDVPQIKNEERMPPFSEVAHSILFSTYSSWDEAAGPFAKKFFQACQVTPAIKKQAAELAGSSDRDDRIKSVALYIAQKVRNVDISLGKVGFKPHKADEVLQNKYGDCRDKAVLMISLLKACGIESFPALVNENYLPLVKDVPTLEQFDSILIAIPREKGYLFLDPMGDMSQFGFVYTWLNSEALVVKPNRTEFAPVAGYEKIGNKGVNTIGGTLSPGGTFSGSISSSLEGVYDSAARYALYHLRGKKLKMYFEQKAAEFCSQATDKAFTLTDAYDLTKNMTITMKIESPDFAIVQDDLMVVEIPDIPFSFSQPSYSTSLPARKYPYVLGSCLENSFIFKIKIPGGFKPLYMPEAFTINEKYGVITVKCNYNPMNSELTFSRNYNITRNMISAKEYPSFKKHLERLKLARNNLIILKKQ